MSKFPDLSIVVPFYNESESIEIFFQRVVPILKKTNLDFEIVCVNDGSRDDTFEKLQQQKKKNNFIRIVNFSRNFGKEAALTAGIDFSEGDAVIPMDCDMQDPPELVPQMIEKWKEGADVVLAKRADRSNDDFLKRTTAKWFYKIYNWLSEIELPENVGDFRLMDRKVVDAVRNLREQKRFMKGLFAFVGFKTVTIEYKRPKRAKGESSWSYWKLWNYAIDGITSFSTFPLKVCMYLGFLVTTVSFLKGLWIICRTVFFGVDVPGYASLMTAILFFGGLQMFCLGIIGEYIGRIYTEAKKRPIYIVRDFIK